MHKGDEQCVERIGQESEVSRTILATMHTMKAQIVAGPTERSIDSPRLGQSGVIHVNSAQFIKKKLGRAQD